MTVKRTQNSGTPAQAQPSDTNITDGTSNTIMFRSTTVKTENPFSKDVFETTLEDSMISGVASEKVEGPQPSAQFNPKELGVDKLTQLQKSSSSSDRTNKADTSSRKNSGILYNGHAGLGDN